MCQINKQKRKEYDRKYYQEHMEQKRNYCQVHKEERKERCKKWREGHKEYDKNWRKKHKEERKEYMKKRHEELKLKVFTKLGNKCARCGFSDPRALQIDHVHGDGIQDRKRENDYHKFLKKVLADTEGNYQLLCANCNWIKKCENGEVRSKKSELENG